MAKNKNIIPIVFATNEGYAPYAGVTITSIIENSSKEYFYDMYVFYTDLSEDTISRFHQIKGDNFSVTCLDVNAHIDRELLYENFHFSKEMYYRILIPTILEQYKKVIYLDCDMVVLGDISELYQTELKGYVLAGVNDVMHLKSKTYVAETLNLDTSKYINSGMLVINCEEFKKQDIKNKCFKTLAEIDIKLRYPDQDIINITCQNKIKFLDPCWNYIWHYNFPRFNQTPDLLLSAEDEKEYVKKSKNIKIIHYTSNVKPWNNYNTVYTSYFFKYADLTPSFKDIIYDRYNNIILKNYVVLQHFDKFEDEIILTGAFYTIEKFLCGDDIYADINGKKQKLEFYYERGIALRNTTFSQRFFRIKLSFEECQKGLSIKFFSKVLNDEKLKILTGEHFPIDLQFGSRAYLTDTLAFFIEDQEFKFSHFSKKEKRRHERFISRKLLTKFGKAGLKSWVVRKLYFLTKPFIKKDIWLVSDRSDIAGDNGEAFFKFLQKNKPQNAKLYFVLKKSSPDYKRLKQYGKVVEPFSKKFYFLFLHCKHNVSSQLNTETYLPYNLTYLKDLRVNNRITFLQHGIIKDDLTKAYSKFIQSMHLFVTSVKDEYDSLVNTPAYGLDEKNVILTGLPRYDYLENKPEKIIYLVPTWRKSLHNDVLSENLEALKESCFYKFYAEMLNNDELIEMIESNGYILKLVPHPLARIIFKDFTPKSQNIKIWTEDVSYREMFKTGSLFVTDYSSAAFDFAYLKKPLVYCQFDQETIYTEHTYKKGYFEYERDAFGPITYDLKSCLKEIKKCIKNNCEMDEKYIKRVNKFFTFNDKNNCQRVLDKILKLDK